MPREETLEQKIRRNKLIAVLTVFVTIVMPIVGFFSIPMPATKNDIVRLEHVDTQIRNDIYQTELKQKANVTETEIKLYLMDEEKYTMRKYENIRQQEEYRLVGKSVPQAYSSELAEIEAKLRETSHNIDTHKHVLIEIKGKLE